MAEIKYIAVAKLWPHPDNPRKDVGDVTELAESIKANGIFQNLTVVPKVGEITGAFDGCYTVIIGHRRLAAAKLAGLAEVPCVVTEMTIQEQVGTMLLENMQRSDLTVYEQAQGFQMMIDLGETVETVAQKTGFSQSTVRRRLKMAELNGDTLREVSSRQISMADFDKLAQVESIDTRNKLLKDIGTYNFDGAVTRAIRAEHRKKVTPAAKKLIKALGLRQLPETERYSSKYEKVKSVDLNHWRPEDGFALKNADGVFYYIDHWGDITFYKKKKKAEAQKKSQAEKEREKAIVDAHSACKEAEAVAFELRQQFVKGITVTQATAPLLLRGAVIGIAGSTVLYKSADRSALLKLIGIDPDGKWDEVRRSAINAITAYNGKDLIPTIVYAAFQDSKTNGYHTGYKACK